MVLLQTAAAGNTMEDKKEEWLRTNTIRCFLCKGFVLYKDGDLSRLRAHLANQHGIFFDVDYLLASCFMDDSQRQAIAKPYLESLNREVSPTSNPEETEVKSTGKKERSSKVKSKKVEKPKVKKTKKKNEKKSALPTSETLKQDPTEGYLHEDAGSQLSSPGPDLEMSLKEEVDTSSSF